MSDFRPSPRGVKGVLLSKILNNYKVTYENKLREGLQEDVDSQIMLIFVSEDAPQLQKRVATALSISSVYTDEELSRFLVDIARLAITL